MKRMSLSRPRFSKWPSYLRNLSLPQHHKGRRLAEADLNMESLSCFSRDELIPAPSGPGLRQADCGTVIHRSPSG